MTPLFVLVGLFSILHLANRFWLKKLSLSLIGLIPVSVLLIFAGAAHFVYEETMLQMMPAFLPYKLQIIYITGVLELFAAIGLLIRKLRAVTAVLLMIFLLAVLPANIIGIMKKLPVAGMDKGPIFLYFRIILQFFFVWWIYYFGIFKKNSGTEDKFS